jgi:hypothetical protein
MKIVVIYFSCLIDEGERDAAESQGLENPSDSIKPFLRSEIKTVGQETQNELIENGAEKRTHISSVDFEIEAKRRRLEGPLFGKQNKENKLDILQVLQEKNSQSKSSTPSPDFVPVDTEDKSIEKSVFIFTSTPAPSTPKTTTNTKKKGVKKTENPPKDKTIIMSPKLSEKKHSKAATGVSNTPKKTSPGKTKAKPKPKPTSSPAKKKNVSPTKSPIKPSPKKKSVKPQETFPKSASPKVAKVKQISPVKKHKPVPLKKEVPPPLPHLSLPIKSDTNEPCIKTQPMPKLIIKPVKLEKSLLSEYSVSQIPLEATFSSEKKKATKRKAKTEPGTLQSMVEEMKPKKKKKKKEPVVAIGITSKEPSLPGSYPASVTSTQMSNDVQTANKVVDIVKKKKKKHKEKDRDKSKQKKVTNVCVCV